jgi:hypothetical protein
VKRVELETRGTRLREGDWARHLRPAELAGALRCAASGCPSAAAREQWQRRVS